MIQAKNNWCVFTLVDLLQTETIFPLNKGERKRSHKRLKLMSYQHLCSFRCSGLQASRAFHDSDLAQQ